MIFMRRFDKRNTDQHAENKAVLDLVLSGQERIESKVDHHIAWHAETAQAVSDELHGVPHVSSLREDSHAP